MVDKAIDAPLAYLNDLAAKSHPLSEAKEGSIGFNKGVSSGQDQVGCMGSWPVQISKRPRHHYVYYVQDCIVNDYNPATQEAC